MKPPPPPKPDTRKHPRFELYASVEMRRGEETLVLPARNISLGGIYLAADGNKLNMFRVGDEVEVMVFDMMDESQLSIRTSAKVVRNEGLGIGLSWSTTDPILSERVARILERLAQH